MCVQSGQDYTSDELFELFDGWRVLQILLWRGLIAVDLWKCVIMIEDRLLAQIQLAQAQIQLVSQRSNSIIVVIL